MLVLNLGVPRSGTVLVFNVLREILSLRQIPFRAVNANYPETEAFLRQHDFRDNVVLHAHNVLPEVQKALQRNDVVAFFNHRDPRDVLVSMMRLHEYGLERTLGLVEKSFAQLRVARRFPKVMLIAYEQLICDAAPFILRIGEKTGVALSAEEAAAVAGATSLDAHRRIMEAVAAETVPVQRRNNPTRVLRESPTHFVNDRHIQSGASGRWRRELTEEQQALVHERLAPLLAELEELGYQ